MAKIELTIPDAKATEALLGISTRLNYQEQITNTETGELEDNPQSRAEFVKAYLVSTLKRLYRGYKTDQLNDEIEEAGDTADEFTSDFN